MACRERGGSKILLYFGLFLLASGTFCQCSRLAVKSRRNSPPIPSKRDVSYSGRLLISQQVAPPNKATSDILDADSDYQGDMGWDFYKQASMQDEHFSKAVTHQLIKMDPKVECTTDSMKFQVQDVASTPGSLIWVDRGSLAPLPLSKLPQSCGYTIGETQNEMFLVTPYDGCFVTLEGDSYVLPLLWWGLPMRMSCPVTRPSSSPPMVTCYTEGMIVKTEWRVPPSRIKINVNGKWELINAVLHKCGIGVVGHGEGVVLSVNYGACVEKKDGMYTVELAGEGTTKISCPSMAPGLSEPTTSPTPTKLEPPNIGLIPSHSFYYPPSSHSKPAVPPNLRPVGNPLQPEPGHGEQPVNPLVPVQPENEPKPSPQLSQQQTPYTPSYLFPYPLNPTLDPVHKPPAAPHETEVPHVEKPHYLFLPNSQTKDTKTVPSPIPAKPQRHQVPSGHFHKPYYPFLPNPRVQPGQGAKPASPNNAFYPLQTADAKPTSSQPENPEAQTGQASHPLYPYRYPFFHENEPPPSQPQEPGEVHQPVNPFPLKPLPGTVLKRNNKPMPVPQPTGNPLDQIHLPKYPYTYPRYPMRNPKIPIKNPKLEVPPDQVQEPGYQYAFPYPYLPLPNTNEPIKTPLLDPENPEVPPGPVHQPPESYTHPVYHMPSLNEPTKMPKQQKTAVTQSQVDDPVDPYPYLLYPMPSPAEPTKRPMPKPQRPEVTPGQVDEPINPYLYPYYPMATPKKPTNKPLPNPPYPEIAAGPVEKPAEPYPYPRYHMPSSNEPTNKPMPNPQNHEVTPGEVEQPTDPYPNPLYPMLSPQEPTKKLLPTPQKPEVPPDAVKHPANAYPYPLYPTSSPGVPAKKPLPEQWPVNPQIPGPLNQSPNPYQNPFYLKPGPKDPAKKPIPNPWLIEPQQPKVPHGHFKQPSDPYPFPRYPRPNPKEPAKTQMPDPWPFKPPDLGVAHGQVKQPSKPYLFPPYPQPSPKEPAKKPMLDPSLLKPAAPVSHVEQPGYPIWHENKLRAKLDQPPALSLHQSLVQQPYNPYLVYPMPNPELPQKPIPLSHPPESKQPEIPGHVHQPAKPFPPFNVGAVINNPPKPEVPRNAYWPLEPHTPVKPAATHVDTQKPKGEKSATIQPREGKMPHPQWQQSVTLPPAKEPQQATPPPPQHTDGAVVPQGSSGCVQLCAIGFSSCCPQITFHQHLYLASHGPSDKVTGVVSQEFPFVASWAHFGPRTHIGHTLPDQKPDEEKYNPETASDSLPNKNQPYHQAPGVNPDLSGSIPYKEAAPRRESYPFLGPNPNLQYSSLPYEMSPNLPPSISPQDMPLGVQNSFYIPVNQEAQNKHSKKPNDLFRGFNYWPHLNGRSPLAPYLEQRNPNGMTAPRAFFGSDWPSHLGVEEELGPLFPYSMLNDAKSTKNTSFAQNLRHSSHRKKHKKSSTRDPTGRLSEPKAYILLQRGPPGKEPRRSLESQNNFRVLPNQDVPGQHLGKPLHLEHVSTRNLKSLLEGLFKSSQNDFQPRKSQTNPALGPGSKEWSSTDTDWTVALKERVTS